MENRKTHKKTLILLDILMIIGLMSNVGAMIITNAMVAKAQPDAVFIEVNPVAAKAYNLEQAPKEQRLQLIKNYGGKLIHLFIMGIALGIYIWMRHRANHWRDYLLLCVMVSIWFTILIMNFGNDFGYYLGRVLI